MKETLDDKVLAVGSPCLGLSMFAHGNFWTRMLEEHGCAFWARPEFTESSSVGQGALG